MCPLVKTALEQRTLQFYLAPVLPPDATKGNSFSFVKLIIVRQLLTVLVSVMMATFMQTTRRKLSYRRSSVQSLSSPSSLRFNSLGKSRYNLFYYAVCPAHFGIARSVRLSVPWRNCPGYRHAGCRSPEMCGLRTRPRTDIYIRHDFCHRPTAIGGGISGRYLV